MSKQTTKPETKLEAAMPKKMTPQQALQNLAACAAMFKGTLADHQALQESLGVLDSIINPK